MPSSNPDGWFPGFRKGLGEFRRDHVAGGAKVGLDRFEIQERLGEGGAAIVYRARDRDLGRDVALKVLREPLVGQDATPARERFQREAKVAALLTHPNVVRIYDVGEASGRLYIVMELVEGRTFAHLLGARIGDAKSAVRFLERASRGVAAAHASGIVHRDLKPGNILVTRDGEPKVGDFGLAHIIGGEAGLTREGTVMGTPLYMAPEQVRGQGRQVSPRTDVYALGAILYEILTSRPPHIGETVTEIYGKIVGEEPIAPGKLNVRASGDLGIVALKALEKDPDRRYATAADFADDLRRWLDGEPILAKPPGLVTLTTRWTRRHRTLSAVGAVTLLFLGLLAGVLAAGAAKARERKAADLERFLQEGRQAGSDLERFTVEVLVERQKEKKLAAALPPDAPKEDRQELWDLQKKIDRLEGLVAARSADRIAAFTSAHGVAPGDPIAKKELAKIYFAEYEEAERRRDPVAMAKSARMLAVYDDGLMRAELAREGILSIDSVPSGADIELRRYVEGDDRRLVDEPMKVPWATPLSSAPLPPGSYLLLIRKAGYREARFPLLIRRGETLIETVTLYRDAEIGEEFIQVPAGRFLAGDGMAVEQADDFFIARHEATFRDYIAFLGDLLAQGREEEARKRVPRRSPDEGFLMSIPKGARSIDGLPAEDILRCPICCISWHDAEAYCDWRSRKEGRPGRYRLPTQKEWEKAARGADGRTYPWGNHFDETFPKGIERGKAAFTEAVGSRPKDCSPYGVLDMAGSMQEWCADPYPEWPLSRYVRGGHLATGDPALLTTTVWQGAASAQVNATIGFRIVKEAPKR